MNSSTKKGKIYSTKHPLKIQRLKARHNIVSHNATMRAWKKKNSSLQLNASTRYRREFAFIRPLRMTAYSSVKGERELDTVRIISGKTFVVVLFHSKSTIRKKWTFCSRNGVKCDTYAETTAAPSFARISVGKWKCSRNPRSPIPRTTNRVVCNYQ